MSFYWQGTDQSHDLVPQESQELLQAHICVNQENMHKATLLRKADVNPDNPSLSFSFRLVSHRMHIHTCVHRLTRIRAISQETVLIVLNLYPKLKGVLHLCNRWKEKEKQFSISEHKISPEKEEERNMTV